MQTKSKIEQWRNEALTEAVQLTNRKRTLIFLNIVISCIATSMLATALTTALPAIINDMQITVITGQWLTSGYSLAMGIMMPLTAFLITRFTTKKLYLSALAIFILGLATSAVAPNFGVMMLGRILQASGNGILSSMAQVILLSIYPVSKRGTVMGWYGLSIGAAPVIAPTLAGLVVDAFGWQAIFYIAIVIVALSFICAAFAFADVLDTAAKKFDTLSFIISALAFGGITLGIGHIGSYDFVSVQVLLLLVVGVVAAGLFIYRQLHMEEPFLDVRVLKNRNFALGVIGSMLLYLSMMGSSMLLPLYVQSIMGLSATVSGLVALPGSAVMAIISPLAGKLYDRIGIRALFIAGASLMFVSNIGMTLITMETSIWIAAALNALRNAAIGCLMMPLVTWGTNSISREMMPHGTALLTSLRTIAGAIGTAVFVGMMTMVAAGSVDTYGSDAAIHGLNVTFLGMSLVALVLLAIGLFFVKSNRSGRKIAPRA